MIFVNFDVHEPNLAYSYWHQVDQLIQTLIFATTSKIHYARYVIYLMLYQFGNILPLVVILLARLELRILSVS